MSNASLAAQAVAQGPLSAAPPSFNGHGWLVVINLAGFTFAFLIFAMLAAKWWHDIWRNRHRDCWNHPVTLFRGILALIATAGTIRFGIGMVVLWGWNPLDPASTATYLTLQRFFDPIAAAMGIAAVAIAYLSEGGTVAQLRKRPLPEDIWAKLPMLRRPAILASICVVMAIGVVSTR